MASSQQQQQRRLSPDHGRADEEGGREESLSPLEQQVLEEYARLAGNLGDVSTVFHLYLHFGY